MKYVLRLTYCFLWGILTPLMALGAVSERDTTAVITVPAVAIAADGTAILSVQMENDEDAEYNGYQFDILLPQGVSIAENDSNFIYSLSQRYDENAMVRVKDYGDGCYRIMVFSISSAVITGTEGELISFTLRADSTLEIGTYQGMVVNFKLSSKIGITFMGTDASFDIQVQSAFRMGDVNHDGMVDISDVMMTVYYSLKKQVMDFYVEEADTNKDGIIDIVDVMNIVNIVIKAL